MRFIGVEIECDSLICHGMTESCMCNDAIMHAYSRMLQPHNGIINIHNSQEYTANLLCNNANNCRDDNI